MTSENKKHNKLLKKFVCFDISPTALSIINDELSEADRTTVFWRAESLADHLYKGYQVKWEDPSGTIGEWNLPTIDKEITVHWRFEGVENSLPLFHIGDISWKPKEDEAIAEEEVAGFSKVRRLFLLLLAIVALLTIVAEELGALSNAVTHLFEITTAIVTSIMAFKE